MILRFMIFVFACLMLAKNMNGATTNTFKPPSSVEDVLSRLEIPIQGMCASLPIPTDIDELLGSVRDETGIRYAGDCVPRARAGYAA